MKRSNFMGENDMGLANVPGFFSFRQLKVSVLQLSLYVFPARQEQDPQKSSAGSQCRQSLLSRLLKNVFFGKVPSSMVSEPADNYLVYLTFQLSDNQDPKIYNNRLSRIDVNSCCCTAVFKLILLSLKVKLFNLPNLSLCICHVAMSTFAPPISHNSHPIIKYRRLLNLFSN